MATPEAKLKNLITHYLMTKGIYFFNKVQKAGDAVGIPDIIACDKNGRFVGIETKVKPYKQSDPQKKHEELITDNNGIYILAFSLDDVKKHFEKDFSIDKKRKEEKQFNERGT